MSMGLFRRGSSFTLKLYFIFRGLGGLYEALGFGGFESFLWDLGGAPKAPKVVFVLPKARQLQIIGQVSKAEQLQIIGQVNEYNRKIK